jgi:hypothetical protein
MATCALNLDGGSPGSASVMAHMAASAGCCRTEDAPVPCVPLPGVGEELGAYSPLQVTRCTFGVGSERRSDSTMRLLRPSVCGMHAGLNVAAATAAGAQPWLLSAASLLVTPGQNLGSGPGIADQTADAPQGLHVGLSAEAALSRPLSMDPAAPRTGCTVATLQHAETARTFRRLREVHAERLRRECGGVSDRGLAETVQCVRARQEVRLAYTKLREGTAASAEEVVRACFPGANEAAPSGAGPASPLDALAAATFRLAARPAAPTEAEPLGEDSRACALRGDVARELCGGLPAALLQQTASQLRALCGVDVMRAMAEADRADDPLGAASELLRASAKADPAAAGLSGAARRWCPAMLTAAADGVDNLRARLTSNPALGLADRFMCGNLLAASACLGPGGREMAAAVAPPAGEQQGAAGEGAAGEEEKEGDDDEEEFEILPDGRKRRRPPPDLGAREGANADTVNVFADVFDRSVSQKELVVSQLSRIVEERLPTARVERLFADEIPSNTGLAAESQHAETCFLHCHARGEEGGGDGKVLNCRLFTPPAPGTQCQRAVISVADESPLPEGADVRDRTGPAYDAIRGVLDSFVGCNVSRGGTVNGLPASAVNVRLEPFGSERWKEAGARYGFCYVERDQAAQGPGAETLARLANMRQPSGNYMVAYATSRARDGGRMAQRECKMLLDLQQNVCRHRWSRDLDNLPGYTAECGNLPLSEPVTVDDVPVTVGVPVPLENGDTVTEYVPVLDFPRKACEIRKLAEACGRISNFAVGEPRMRNDPTARYGVPDASDLYCPDATALAGAAQWNRAGSTAGVGKQEYETTVWADADRTTRTLKESLETGCEATCALYHDYTDPAQRFDFIQCVTRCFAELQV